MGKALLIQLLVPSWSISFERFNIIWWYLHRIAPMFLAFPVLFLLNQIRRRFLNSIHILLPNQKFLINSYWHQDIPGLWPISNKIPRVLHPAGPKAQSHSSRSLILGLWMTFIPYLSGMNDLGLFSLDGHTALAREDQSPSSAPRNKFHWAGLSKKLTPETLSWFRSLPDTLQNT